MTPWRIQKYPKTRRLHELFRKIRMKFCLRTRDTNQEPSRNWSEFLFRWTFHFGGLRGWLFLLWKTGTSPLSFRANPQDPALERVSRLIDWSHRSKRLIFQYWRMCPRSGFRSGGTCERTLVSVFVPGGHPNVPSFQFSFRWNIRQNHPFWKTTLLTNPDVWVTFPVTPRVTFLGEKKIWRKRKLTLHVNRFVQYFGVELWRIDVFGQNVGPKLD